MTTRNLVGPLQYFACCGAAIDADSTAHLCHSATTVTPRADDKLTDLSHLSLDSRNNLELQITKAFKELKLLNNQDVRVQSFN